MHNASFTKIAFGFVTALVACSSGSTAPDSGAPDAASDPLSFKASNLGNALATIDTSKLGDIDVSGTSNELGVSCNSVSGGGCVAMTVTQSDGSTAQLYVARSWKIEPNGALPVKDSMPVIIVATQTISILGQLDASATGQFTVGGGHEPASPGPGVGGAGVNSSPTSMGVGGGGASFCGAGGAGGQATATNGTSGKAYGNASLVPLLAGSSGGIGDLAPGAGGGAIQLVAGVSIDVGAGGVVSVGGGGGSDGTTTGNYGASGGGSGGAILLEAPTVSIEGTLEANGGGGGGGLNAPTIAADATPNATPAAGGGSGTGLGGSGSAGSTVSGGAGAAGDALGGNNVPAAGGGGAGFIRINTTSGSATLAGTLSPASGTCMSQGTLAH